MSFSRYKTVDIFVFALITILFESICAFAITKWFPDQTFTVSITFAVVAIVMMRWKYFAAIHAVLGGLTLVFIHRAAGGNFPAEGYAIYPIGNLFALSALLIIKAVGDEKIRKVWYFTLLYVVTIYLSVELGRALLSLAFGKGFILGSFLLADSVSFLFLTVASFVARSLDGMFEDQKKYLLRTHAKKREEAS